MRKAKIAIIGGGCAGLTVAIQLAKQGCDVSLFEASSELGGRARSVQVKNTTAHALDNGQHILIGAYSATLQLLATLGVPEKQAFLRLPFSIRMLSQGLSRLTLKTTPYLPSPLAMLIGLLGCQGLKFSERLAAIGMMLRVTIKSYRLAQDLPLAEFLAQQGQSENTVRLLWEPISLAALNTPLELASTQVFLNALKDTLAASFGLNLKKNSDFLLAKQDLSKLIAEPASVYLKQHGVSIKLKQRITAISKSNQAYRLIGAEESSVFSHVVLATAPHHASQLTAGLAELQAEMAVLAKFSYQPIVTVYLQYPAGTRLTQPMLGLANGLGQWVFDRGQLCQQDGLLAVVISGTGQHQGWTQDQLSLKVIEDLKQTFPDLGEPLWHKVIAEKRATYACTPNLARPSQRTALLNFYLAGDYTYANYPATIEGAVRSGLLCAELIGENLKTN